MTAQSRGRRGRRRSLLAVTAAIVATVVSLTVGPVSPSVPRASAAVSTPSTADVRSSHPRLLADKTRIAQLRGQAASDPVSQALKERVLAEAAELRTAPRLRYKVSSGRMLGDPAELVDRSYTLIVAWTLSGKKSYLDLLWKDLGPATRLTSWNPDNMLDTAELTHAAAIGYDWAHSAWSPSQRTQLRTAIVRLGLEPSLKIYGLTESARSPFRYLGNWRAKPVNVNTIINSSMMMGAIAVSRDSTSATVQRALTGATKSIRYGLSQYERDGGFSEGPTYWAWATRSATAALISLKGATGSDHGLASAGGLKKTARFALDLRSADDTIYNFADSSALPGAVNLPLAGLARLYGSASIGAASGALMPGGYGRAAQQLIMRDPAWKNAVAATGSLQSTYATGIVTARSSTTSPDATYLAFRSASRFDNFHQHIDPGDFQLAALGEEWAVELGSERAAYNLPDRATSSARWNYYRTATAGHNTVTVAPSVPGAVRPVATKAGPSGASPDEYFATTDASAAVSAAVKSWKRGVRLFDGRSQVLVQDEFTSRKNTEAMWGMHTRAAITLSADGRQAVLAQNGKRMLARIVSGAGTRFTDMPATALPASPQPSQEDNDGVRRLSIWFPVRAGVTTTLAVQFTPLPSGVTTSSAPSANRVTAMSSWKPMGSSATLRAVTVDGAALPAFSGKTTSYDIPVTDANALPRVAATGAGTISVVQATRSTMTARVTVSRASTRPTTYLVRFLVVGDRAVVSDRAPQDPRSRTLDGSPDTAWDPASVSSRSLVWRLTQPAPLRSVMMTMSTESYGSTRVRLEVSRDRKSWSAPTSGTFTGPTATVAFPVTPLDDARYVRLTVPSGAARIAEAMFLRYDASVENTRRPAAVPRSAALVGITTKPGVGASGRGSVKTTWSTTAKADTTTTWVTSNPRVLAVSSSGAWRAVGRGSAQIGAIVTTRDGISVTTTKSVTVGAR